MVWSDVRRAASSSYEDSGILFGIDDFWERVRPLKMAGEVAAARVNGLHASTVGVWREIGMANKFYCCGRYCPGLSYSVPHPPTCSVKPERSSSSVMRIQVPIADDGRIYCGQVRHVVARNQWAVRRDSVTVLLTGVPTYTSTREDLVSLLREAGYDIDREGKVFKHG